MHLNKYTVNIIDIPIYVGNSTSFINEIIDSIITKPLNYSNRLISATSAHGLVFAYNNPTFKNTLLNFYYNIPDGQPMAWIGQLKGHKNMRRCPGVGTFGQFMSTSASLPIKHFFCGGKEGIADDLKNACANKFENTNVVGTYSPPFRVMTDEELTKLGAMINAAGANIVWIGLSTPKQEAFAENLAKYCNVDYIITVGAVFDFFTDNLKHAPLWIRNLGLEWLYRLLKEPRRLFSRYAEVVPMFIWLNVKEYFIYLFGSKNKRS